MLEIKCSAPGKLVLIGEYAVLYGHPAAVIAVDRRAHVQLRSASGKRSSVVAPGLEDRRADFVLERDGGVRWSDRSFGERLTLAEATMDSLIASGVVDPRAIAPFHASLDTREFFENTDEGFQKLGVGSSAALGVALASALACWSGRQDVLEPRLDWLGKLLRLHRDFQGGRGSGIDLAASLIGGVVEYQLADEGSVARAEPLTLPHGLHLTFIWTRRAASTGGFLERLSQAMVTNRAGVGRVLNELGEVSLAGVTALREAKVREFVEATDTFCDGMAALGREAGLQILSEVHIRLRDLARRHGIHYKPSGAGGGDVGIAATDDPEAALALARAVGEAGFPILELAVDDHGLLTRSELDNCRHEK